MKKLPFLSAAAGLAAVGVYRAVKGYGIFNKFRFPKEHSAVSRYIETHHPGATYSSIQDTDKGYSTIVTSGESRFLLHLTLTPGGIYVFSEKPISQHS